MEVLMQSINQVAQHFRGLKFNNLADSLDVLLKEAEEKEKIRKTGIRR